jgi:hypothetical protein
MMHGQTYIKYKWGGVCEIFHIYRSRYKGEYKDNQHGQQGIRKIRHITISKEEL